MPFSPARRWMYHKSLTHGQCDPKPTVAAERSRNIEHQLVYSALRQRHVCVSGLLGAIFSSAVRETNRRLAITSPTLRPLDSELRGNARSNRNRGWIGLKRIEFRFCPSLLCDTESWSVACAYRFHILLFDSVPVQTSLLSHRARPASVVSTLDLSTSDVTVAGRIMC